MDRVQNDWASTLGATVTPAGVRFGVWAPIAERVELVIEHGPSPIVSPMDRGDQGVWTTFVPGIGAGTLYRFAVDGKAPIPDPRSRYQPRGVHGPSEVIDLGAFDWTDEDWPGLVNQDLSVYEVHVGAYTPKGTFDALTTQLAQITQLGVRVVELMPVAAFPGRWGWGYDGVALYAPACIYGRPEELQRLIDTAHHLGLGVLLDVVYNHLGPDGNYLTSYSADYFTDRHHTPWGEAINCDGPNTQFVRDFVIENAIQWVRDYHFDGLRLDAIDMIRDDSSPNILEELTSRVRAAVDRPVFLVAEDARNEVRTITPVAEGGHGFDAVWADDFHHDMRVFLSNAWENYFADFTGSIQELVKAVNEGFIYQGEMSPSWGRPRGTDITDEPANAFVIALQNHDQIGNRPFGERLHHEINRERFLVASALLLLAPETPLLFMGQEFAASTPFLFFSDHHDELGRLVTEGRRQEFGGFRAFQDERTRQYIPDPQAESTFLASKLRLSERETHRDVYRLYRRLLQLRNEDPVFQIQDRSRSHAHPIGGAALSLHRWNGNDHRVLIANFGAALAVPIETLELGAGIGMRDLAVILAIGDEMAESTSASNRPEDPTPGPQVQVPARSALLFGFQCSTSP